MWSCESPITFIAFNLVISSSILSIIAFIHGKSCFLVESQLVFILASYSLFIASILHSISCLIISRNRYYFFCYGFSRFSDGFAVF